MRVYERIWALIEDKGLPVAELASKSGIDEETLKSLLNGRKKLYYDDLLAICFALNVSPEMFIDTK